MRLPPKTVDLRNVGHLAHRLTFDHHRSGIIGTVGGGGG